VAVRPANLPVDADRVAPNREMFGPDGARAGFHPIRSWPAAYREPINWQREIWAGASVPRNMINAITFPVAFLKLYSH